MSVNVSFAGPLMEDYDPITLQAKTPQEIVALMEANHPGFKRKLIQGNYGMVIYTGEGEETEAQGVTEERLYMPISNENVIFIPVPRGEAATWFFITSQIVIATGAQTAAGYTLAAIAAAAITAALAYGVVLALSGLAKMLSPEMPDDPDNVTGYQFNGPVNTSKQGAPVPVCYGGPIMVGSQVISVALATEDIPI